MNAQEAQVDVGIPTYGEAEFLAAAVESVLAQTLGSWRLWIASDGPGRAEEIVKPHLGDPRITLLPSGSERRGAPWSHTRLLQVGEAPLVAFLHHDDLWMPDALAGRARFLQAHPTSGFVFSANTRIDSNGREIGRSRTFGAEREFSSAEIVPAMLRQNPVGRPSAVLARRSAYETVGPWFEEFEFYDLEMWLRLAVRFPVGYLPAWDVACRVHEGQITVQGRRGEQNVAFVDHVAKIIQAGMPEAALTLTELRSRRSAASLSAALDAAERGELRRALHWLAAAVRQEPRAVLDPRAGAVLVALFLGRPGRSLVRRLRNASRQKWHGSEARSDRF